MRRQKHLLHYQIEELTTTNIVILYLNFSIAGLFTAKRDCGQKCPSKVCKHREYKSLQIS